MPKLDVLLSRLNFRRTGKDSYMAKCPAHDDRTASLTIREIDQDHILLKCFAGCETENVLGAIGLSFSDVMPDRVRDELRKPQQIPFNARDVLAALYDQCILVVMYANDVQKGRILSDDEMLNLCKVVGRIGAAAELARAQ